MSEPAGESIVPIRCACGVPIAELTADGRIRILAKHHGARHESLISLRDLVDLRARLEVRPA